MCLARGLLFSQSRSSGQTRRGRTFWTRQRSTGPSRQSFQDCGRVLRINGKVVSVRFELLRGDMQTLVRTTSGIDIRLKTFLDYVSGSLHQLQNAQAVISEDFGQEPGFSYPSQHEPDGGSNATGLLLLLAPCGNA